MSGIPRASAAILLAALVSLSVASVYITIVLKLDNTNVGTTNGLWKSPMVKGWETGASHELDNGEWLYGPLYGFLCRLIPDRAVSSGMQGAIITVRKMAVLNAIFGGIASGAVFLLALRFVSSLRGALLVALAHACSAFVILNSVNSEDVIPSYAFFTLTVLFLFEYLRLDRPALLLASALCCLLMTLLHWTLMLPCLAAVSAVGVWLFWKEGRRGWIAVAFFGLFLGFAAAVAMAWGPIGSLRDLLYPAKAHTSEGYLGFGWTKVIFMFIGVGNYFCGGGNFGDYYAAMDNFWHRIWIAVSWSFTLVALAGIVAALVTAGKDRNLRLLAVFGAALFCAGEAEHLYSQPQDPQSQIQPMFACVIGLTILVSWLERTPRRRFLLRLYPVAPAVFFLLIGMYNTRVMFWTRGEDSRYQREVTQLAQMFPPASSVVVSHGWEKWNTWMFMDTFGGDWRQFRARTVPLVMVFNDHPGISGDAAADIVVSQIAAALKKGDRVVAATLWIGRRDTFPYSLSSVADIQTARPYADRLFAAFRAGRRWDTPVGVFVELELPPGQ